tara:strand:+ start:138 stop:671 length:534 start_codon:yes stop_codon:yes gene_type:complete
MDSSKFSSPFLNKSPLQGAYYSGADGMVTVSYADIHKDFQKGLSDNVAKAREMHDKKNVNNCDGLDDKLLNNKMSSSVHATAKKICAERNKKPVVKKPKFKEDGSLNVDSFSKETQGTAKKVNEMRKTNDAFKKGEGIVGKGESFFENVTGLKPFEKTNIGLSDYKISNKNNPFYQY